MRRSNVGWLGFIVLVTALAIVLPATAIAQTQGNQTTTIKAEALVGTYQGTATHSSGATMSLSMTLKFDKDSFAGTVQTAGVEGGIPISGGTLTGDRLVLTFDMAGAPATLTCTVKNPARLEGTWTAADGSGTVTLARVDAEATKPAPDTGAAAVAPAAGATGQKPAAAAGDSITGQWDGVSGNSDMSVPFTMNLKLDGEKVTGDISSEQGGAPLSTGTWKNGALNLSFESSA